MTASLVEGSQLCGRQVWIRLVADISFLNNQLAMDGPLLPAWYGIRYADRWPSRGHPRSVWGKEAVPPCALACHRGSRRRPFRPLHPLLHPSKSPLQRLFIRNSACNVGASGRPADMSLGFDGNRAREEAGRLEMMSFASSSASGPGYRRYKGMGCVVLNRGGVNLESRGGSPRERLSGSEIDRFAWGRGRGTGGGSIIDSRPGDESQTRRPGTVCLVACLLRQVSGQRGSSEAKRVESCEDAKSNSTEPRRFPESTGMSEW